MSKLQATCIWKDCDGGPQHGVARSPSLGPHSSLDDQYQAFLEQLVGARGGVECCYSANMGCTHDPDLLILGLI